MRDDVADGWVDRPVLARLVRAGGLLAPLLAAAAVVQLVSRLLLADRDWPLVLQIVVLAVVALATGWAGERLARRLLPLAGLLRMTMVFRTGHPPACGWHASGPAPASSNGSSPAGTAEAGPRLSPSSPW